MTSQSAQTGATTNRPGGALRWQRLVNPLLLGFALVALSGCDLDKVINASIPQQDSSTVSSADGSSAQSAPTDTSAPAPTSTTPVADTSGSTDQIITVTDPAPAPTSPVADSGGTTSNPTTGSNTTTATPMLVVSWNPSTGSVQGYDLYYGATPDTANTEFSKYAVDSGALDPTAPSVQIDAVNQLGLRSGEQICFSVRAYNQYGTSGYSTPACATVL